MDTQNLFGKQKDAKPQKAVRSIACGDEIDDQPMILGLKQGQNRLILGNSLDCFNLISQGSVDMGFISSIDFSKLKGGWKVFAHICKASDTESRIKLFFNKDLSEISTVAVSEYSSTSTVVLQIILKELYEVECEIIKTKLGVKSALKEFDAVLLTGNSALREAAVNNTFIDIGEEWRELTGLPLVYGFWIGSELIVNQNDHNQLKASVLWGQKSIDKIVENAHGKLFENYISDNDSKGKSRNTTGYLSKYLSQTIRYNFGDEEKDSLAELYKYAFFYGFVDYIPDFNFLG
jgi:chorismate dehydratase